MVGSLPMSPLLVINFHNPLNHHHHHGQLINRWPVAIPLPVTVTAKACVWWLCDWYVFSELFLLHMHHLTLLNISWSSTTNGSCGSGQTRASDHLIYVSQPGTRNGTERKGSYKQGNSIVYYYYPTDSSVPRKWLAQGTCCGSSRWTIGLLFRIQSKFSD